MGPGTKYGYKPLIVPGPIFQEGLKGIIEYAKGQAEYFGYGLG